MKIKNYIKSLGFGWTDITIIPFFVFVILFVLEDVRLMTIDISEGLSQPFWAYTIYSIIGFLCLSIFLFVEYRKGRKPQLLPLSILLILLITSIISICLSKNTISLSLLDLNYNPITILLETSFEAKFIHVMSFLFFIISLFLLITIFPKKFSNYCFLSLTCYVAYAVTIFSIIYSLFADNYILLFKLLLDDSIESYSVIKENLPISIFGNPNRFAIFLELILFISLFHHSVSTWKGDYVFTFTCLLFLIITLCKTGILLAIPLLFMYFIFKLIKSCIYKDKKHIILFSIIIFFLISPLVVFLLCYLSSEALQTMVSTLFINAKTFSHRLDIWYIANQIINIRPFFGNGHGLYNHLLYIATGMTVGINLIDSHNSFLTILGEGGIVYLVCYIALIIYSLIIIFKLMKKKLDVSIPLLFGMLLFLAHSIFEDIYYYVEIIIVLSIICFNITNCQPKEQIEKHIMDEA